MREKKNLVIDGNAFYEIDIDCLNRKKKKESGKPRMQKSRVSGVRKKPGD